MKMIITSLNELLGEVPAGFEPLLYLIAGFIVLFLLDIAFTLCMYLLKWVSGKG